MGSVRYDTVRNKEREIEKPMKRLQGKVALVTGAGSGIGREIAHRFHHEGACVVLNDIDSFKIAKVEQELHGLEAGGAEGKPPIVTVADVQNSMEVDDMFREIGNRYGGIDVLVNNAGIAAEPNPIDLYSEDAWDRVLAVNLKSAFLCSKAAIRMMKTNKNSGGGKIINISSVTAILGGTEVGYAASKGGLNSFTKALAREVGRFGIDVNAICPGLIRTELTAPLFSGGLGGLLEDEWIKWCSKRRIGEPADVAHLAVFLASGESGYITGQLIQVDGGII